MSESASGEAINSCNGGDKEFSCPSCPRPFDTLRGMKIHHAQAHGESLPEGREYTCEWCGGPFRALPSTTHRFCGTDCKNAAHSEFMQGRQKEYPVLECDQCGESYQVKPANADSSSFCSRECQWEWQRENWQKDEHPASGEWHYITCEQCGEDIHVKDCEKEKRRFCSKACMSEWQSNNVCGENHPQFDPDSHLNFGPNWGEQAAKCRERDGYECQICGLPQQDHYRALTVHHIKPRKEFISDGRYDWESANRLDNLVTLCSSCHSKVESWPVRPY